MRLHLVVSAFYSVAVGILIGFTAICAAWNHNPQCEFHCPEVGTRVGALLTLWVFSTMASAAGVFVLFGVLPLIPRVLLGLLHSVGSGVAQNTTANRK